MLKSMLIFLKLKTEICQSNFYIYISCTGRTFVAAEATLPSSSTCKDDLHKKTRKTDTDQKEIDQTMYLLPS
jgi:hypothetical protein